MAILNRRLTRAELADVLRREGTLTVAGWNYAARDAMVKQFQAWVQNEFGVDVTLEYVAEETPATFLQKVYAAQQAQQPAPYDVVALDENIFTDARQHNAAEKILPSDLLDNAARIETVPLHEPYALPFQAAATIAPIFHNDAVGAWFHDWSDLADARLKGRITIPQAEGVEAGAFLIGVAYSQNQDYKNPDQMRAAIDFVCKQIVPNAFKATNDFAEMQQLLREKKIDVAVAWNMLARLEGLSGADWTDDIMFRPLKSGQPALNGYAWIPKGAPHPALAQLWVNWRLSDAGQFPNAAWDISKQAWGEYQEGLLGESYVRAIPQWLQENYFKVYPTVNDLKALYRPLDWNYYAEHEAEWLTQYKECAE